MIGRTNRQVSGIVNLRRAKSDVLLDNMRHVQEHAAQLNLILGQKAGWSPRWVAQAKI